MTQQTISAADLAAIVGVIDPDATAAGTVTTSWIDMAQWQEVLGIVTAGTLGASATLDAKFQQATDDSGTAVKDVAGAEITQLTQAGSDSDKQALIAMSAGKLDVDGGFTHVRLSMTVAVATSDAGGLVLGLCPRYLAASANDLDSVAEIVRV